MSTNDGDTTPGPDSDTLSPWLRYAIALAAAELWRSVYFALEKRAVAGELRVNPRLLDEKDRVHIRDTLRRLLAPSEMIGRARLLAGAGIVPMSAYAAVVGSAKPVSPKASGQAFAGVLEMPKSFPIQLDRTAAERADLLADGIEERIRQQIEAGTTLDRAPTIEELIVNAGLSPKTGWYLPMAVRTEVMEAINRGQRDGFNENGLAKAFPVWQYHAVIRPTSRKWHAARNGKYWSSSMTFEQVRGFGLVNTANCLCNWTPVSRARWDRLKAIGAELEPWEAT